MSVIFYSIYYVTGHTAKAMKCVRKKDDKYIGFGTQLSDKQNQNLGRLSLHSKSKHIYSQESLLNPNFVHNYYYLVHLVT